MRCPNHCHDCGEPLPHTVFVRARKVISAAVHGFGISTMEGVPLFYVGVSPTLFDKLVDDGIMPKPIRLKTKKAEGGDTRGRLLWDTRKLDAAFDVLDTEDEPETPWVRQRA